MSHLSNFKCLRLTLVDCAELRDDVLQDALHDELLAEVPRQVVLRPLLQLDNLNRVQAGSDSQVSRHVPSPRLLLSRSPRGPGGLGPPHTETSGERSPW